MIMTFFIRDNNNSYPEPCDVASIKLIKGNKTFYFGSLWGSHTPSDSLECKIEDEKNFSWYEWLKSLGYEVVPEE